MRKAARAGIVTTISLAILWLMLQGLVDRMLYYPMPYPQGDWAAQQDAGAQDVWLTAKDGIRLNAWWFAKPDAEFATLFLHGNAGNVTHRIDHAHAIVMAGSAILVIDYRGYGKSNGHPGETGLYLDADAGYDELIRRGYSPGGFSCKASRLELPPLQNSRPDGRVPASFSNHPSLRCAGWPQRYFRLLVRCLCTGSIQKRRLRKSTRRCF